MIEIVKSVDSFEGDVRDILTENCEAVEPGLVLLEEEFKLDDDLTIDYLLKDNGGKPVIILVGESRHGGELIQRLLLILRMLRKNRFFLDRIFAEHFFDFSKPPRTIVLSGAMTDEFVYCLESIKATEVLPCEYAFLKLEDRTYFTVTCKSGDKALRAARIGEAKPAAASAEKPKAAPAPAPAPAAKPESLGAAKSADASKDAAKSDKAAAPAAGEKKAEAEEPKKEKTEGGVDKAFSAEVFFQTAREKVKRISPKISENRDGNLIRFKINDKVLSSIAVQGDVCYVFLGEKKDKAIMITSDKVLNETLNQIYKLYITQFGPAKTN